MRGPHLPKRAKQANEQPVGDAALDRLAATTVPPSRVLRNLGYQKALGLVTVLEAEMIAYLLERSRTVADIVDLVYRTRKDDPAFHQNYMRVSRTLRLLETRGYVSRRLFGSNKPYRITDYALQKLAGVERVWGTRLVSGWELAIYAGTITAATVTIFASLGVLQVSRFGFMIIYTVLVFLSGVCAPGLVRMFKKVW